MKIIIRTLCASGIALSLWALWMWQSPCNLISLIYVTAVWIAAETEILAMREDI